MPIHAALEDRLLRVREADGGWQAEETLVGHDFECLAADGDRIFAGTVGAGLQYSPDSGDTWHAVDFEDRVTSVTVGPDGTVWVGTEPSAVYRVPEGDPGATKACADLTALPSSGRWSFPPRPHTHHVRWVAVAPDDPDRLYVAIEAGAFVRSTDAGESWEPRPGGARRDNHTVATHPDAPERVYVAAGDGYAESEDRGERWRYPQEGLEHRYVWGLAVDPGDPSRTLVSAARGARSAHTPANAEAYVYRREVGGDGAAGGDGDGGAWQLAMDGLPDPEGTVRAVLAAGRPGEFYALTNRGLYRSGDAGRSWTGLPVEWPGTYTGQVGRGLAVV